MSYAVERGVKGEQVAKEFLENLGLKFIDANWSCKMGEVDLIFQDGDERVFIEVRSRKQTSFGDGADTVFYQKQKKLLRAAKLYQQKKNYWGHIRFDVISIELREGLPPVITHIPYAFMDE